MFGCECCCLSSIVYYVGVITIAIKVVPFLQRLIKGEKPLELQEKNYKKDVVYLYQFPGSATASSLSPFCIKVEAFCRLHKLQFERRNTFSARGQKGLLPFIELNGQHHADSQIIFRRLIEHFQLKAYPDEQAAAIGHAIDRLLDNHFFNLKLMTKKGVSGKAVAAIAAGRVPTLLIPLVSLVVGWLWAKKMGERAAIAVGQFKEKEYNELLRNDIIQLQTILGKKQFLLGEEPSAVDCTAFGQLASTYATPTARFYLNDLLDSSEFSPLRDYIDRVKTRIFGNEFCDVK
ncbi:hypothetical protein PENTCL1PPCAC_8365 [Pristionchus entomophagus]|uniref:Glutathione S-transferase n=1 Tax=Pristionchus entomophagus TaxID=358040 RepID=A0AAV5T1H6_9BILA|nr:hypothetical protein PENTCL1PPCAC_8365 [Pristionchus entomophagus]